MKKRSFGFTLFAAALVFLSAPIPAAAECIQYPAPGYNCGSAQPGDCSFCESGVCLPSSCTPADPQSCAERLCPNTGHGSGAAGDSCWKDCGGNRWKEGTWDCCHCSAECELTGVPACHEVGCQDGGGRGERGGECWVSCGGAPEKGTWNCCQCEVSCGARPSI